jgi:(S)-2-hydroxy-acid oxidase
MDKLVCIGDFEKEAHRILDKNALDYYRSGADEEITLRENRSAFKRWIIRPRMLVDVSTRDLTTEVLGKKVGFPLGVSPSAMQKLAHEDGELANTRAAAAMDTIYILSTIATSSIEEVAKANPRGRKWFQLYVYKNREQSLNLIRRAEAAGFEALVLTVDAPYFGKRRANMRNKFHLPPHLRLANFAEGTGESACLMANKSGGSAMDQLDTLMDQTLTWKDVTWLKNNTRLPVIVKGVMTAEDANLAIAYGVSGIFVSNHGGRQLDTVLASIDALPEIVAEVKGRCDIYLDGGVSSGTDVFKALALGAKMVFAGRPLLWGLSVAGEQGAKRVLEIYKEELDLTMALAGVQNVKNIDGSYVARASNL